MLSLRETRNTRRACAFPGLRSETWNTRGLLWDQRRQDLSHTALQHAGEPVAGVGVEAGGDLFGCAFGDDVATGFPALGSKVDNPVGGFNDVEIVFDDDERAAAVDELAEGGEELGDVVEVEAGGGLVEDVEDAAGLGGFGGGVGGAHLGEVGCELDALSLAAG